MPPTFYVLHPFPQVSLETVRVAIPPDVFGPEIAKVVVEGAAVSEVAEPAVDDVAVEPEIVLDVEFEAAETEVVSVADAAEPQAFADIVFAFDALVPVSVVAVEVYSPERPMFFVFPNIDYFASSSSSVEVVG